MAFKRPQHLIPVSFTWLGALDAITAQEIGKVQFDGEIYYIDVQAHDANATFSQTALTILADSTTLDVITLTANTKTAYVTKDDLTEGTVTAGQAIKITAADVATGADLGVSITLWMVPSDRH
jgi:hypothetical protein